MTLAMAIETTYGGCRFRSRLEARWAVFFTRLGLEWEYEPQGFVVGREFGRPRNYLPDFYLPALGLYVEVKPAAADQVDPDGVSKWEDFAGEVATMWDHDRAAIFCGPIPNPEAVTDEGPSWSGRWYDTGIYITGDCCYWWCACPSGQHYDIQFEARGGRILCGCPRIQDDRYRTGNDPRILNAYAAARSARFEHGEGPVSHR
ncbi:hypothetical protein M3G91_10230 [Micromonospora chalcea]|uniref:hypothetical protein n=1 Tax=Micromonospora chalcea TaxID=1874 RepID=UPI0021A36CEE|nr:hypothetical protein [Micromonospora chalcea]MCT2278002.1 hypothetical protein [Micromonospora chalcea]